MKRAVSIGECMIELTETAPGKMRRGFGGDTLNTAVYMARELRGKPARVGYVTALGDDPYSDEMVEGWQREGVATDLVARLPGALPGLYAIRTDAKGERSFFYWRRAAAARRLFQAPDIERIGEAVAAADLAYCSGISFAILDDAGRTALLELLHRAQGIVAFDPNYRPRLWPDPAAARHWFEQAARLAAILLPTFDDEAALFGDADPEATVARYGAAETVVKLGAKGCMVAIGAERFHVPAAPVVEVVDTTGAGDSFNGAYLAARLFDMPPEAASRRACRVAAHVVQFPGAIVPRLGS